MGLHDYTVYDFICRNAQLYPNRESIIFKDVRLTHRQYKEKCDQLASGLIRTGIKRGDRLGVVSQNCLEFMVLYGAAAKIGAIMLPVNWRFQPEEIKYVINDCTPRFLFAGPDYRKIVAEVAREFVYFEKCYTIGGGEIPKGFFPFDELYAKEGADKQNDVSADSGYLIIHTAAVEGRPRGALLSQANIVNCNLANMCRYGLTPEDCFLCFLPLYHAAGIFMALAAMHAGGKNIIFERFDPDLVLQMIEKEKGTIFFNFAPILKMIMDKYAEHPCDISSLRVVSGLDTQENVQRFLKLAPHCRYWTGFGQTECMAVSGSPYDEKPGSAGKPSPFAHVALFDDYDNQVPAGTAGEICVRSPMVFLGYWGRDKDNEYTFRNGWHHTGDIGRFDEEGYLWYVKRKAEKELIKPGGENVDPAEVEKVILQNPAIAEVSVIGVRDPEWGEAIKAVCVLKPGSSLSKQELIDFVASRIARYKKPKHVEFVSALPKSQDGVINADKVKAQYGKA